ncbi:MAG: hypothetical protein QOJ64_3959 [Acidobacteriota bacterium]|jgi:septal ring-binding cell division protein DamX|nr:hypothetical protein [Acidobacteriota bacterium]
MATDTQKYVTPREGEARHSALAEFGRDERRPAVLLLSGLVIAVLFFGLGMLIGRWTATPDQSASDRHAAVPAAPTSAASTQSVESNASNTGSSDPQRRFAVLVATYDSADKSKTLVTALQDAGFKDIRTTTPRAGEAPPRYSVLVGRYTQDEARDAVRRLHSANDPRLKNAKVVDGK